MSRKVVIGLCFVLTLLSLWVSGALGDNRTGRGGSGQFVFELDPGTGRTVVYRVEGTNRREIYSVPRIYNQTHLSQDGRFLVACDNWLDRSSSRATVVTAYRDGLEIQSLRLGEIVRRTKSLTRTQGRFYWGDCVGFQGAIFGINTVEAMRIRWDPETGAHRAEPGAWSAQADQTPITAPSNSTVESSSNSPVWIDHCRQPPNYIHCDRFVEYRAGWKQVRGKWEFQTDDMDGDALLYQRSDLGREGNALMYFDNLNVADADIRILFKVDIKMPRFYLEEDAPRIRRLRRIAGAGMVFRLRDEDNYYMFRLAGEEGAVLGKMVDGEWYDLANPRAVDFLNAPLRYEGWYALRVRVRGSHIQCFISEIAQEGDDYIQREQAVVSLHDDTFAIGRVGLVTFHTEAKFSFLRVDPQ